MKVSIIGAGYVGLVTGVCMAEKGHKVICMDVDQQKVNKISRAIPPIYERGLEELLKRNINVNLFATTDLYEAVMESEISLVTVGTPFKGNEINLIYIKEVSHQIGKILKNKPEYHLIVVKSTVVPGTTDEIVRPIIEEASCKKAGIDFGVGMNPEFLREGEAVEDFMFPDRIVLGADDTKSYEILEKLYKPFKGVDIIKTNNKTAEMIKYTSNTLLATMISFSNEIANLCTALGNVDVVEVMRGVHLDKRLSPILSNGNRLVPDFTKYIEAGCGFGGSCFPKDVKALIAHGKKVGNPMRLLEAVIEINERQPYQVFCILKKEFKSLKGVRVAILGLAFKPGTDDMRESPAIPIIKELLMEGAEINAYDPVAMNEAARILNSNNKIRYCYDIHQALENVKAVVLLTRWEEFRKIPDLLSKLDPQPILIDGRRMIEKKNVAEYRGIGISE